MKIWFALLAAPLLALVDQAVAFASVGWACAGHAAALHAVHALFLAAAAASVVPAFQAWSAARTATTGGEPTARRRFLAGVAVASGVFSVLVVGAMWVPTWLISPCSN